VQFTKSFLEQIKNPFSPSANQTRTRQLNRNHFLILLFVLISCLIAIELVTRFLVECFWFEELDYLSVWLTRFQTQLSLGIGGLGISVTFLWINFRIAQRWRYPYSVESHRSHPKPFFGKLKLPILLIIIGGSTLLIAWMVLQYIKISLSFLEKDWQLPFVGDAQNIPSISESYQSSQVYFLLPSSFQLQFLQPFWENFVNTPWQLMIFSSVIALLLIKLRFWLKTFAILFSIFFSILLANSWTRVLQFFNAVSFDLTDPLLERDIGFYIFTLPIWEIIDFWLGGLILYSLLAVILIYICSGNSLSEGEFPGFCEPQLRHLSVLSGLLLLSLSFRHGLARFELLYSQRGAAYGASYTDIHVQLPIETILSIVAAVTGIWLLGQGVGQWLGFSIKGRSSWLGIALYFICLLIGFTLSPIVQQFEVEPNELQKEQPYIERNIALTRQAFELDKIKEQNFDPEGNLTRENINANDQTIDNIRLWDTRPLLQTNRQLQQIRLYYEFPDADIDRYTMPADVANPNRFMNGTELQQMIIAPRELNYNALPSQGQTWINRHLVYTHGYGFTLSPVNQVTEGGIPKYYVQDIGTGEQEGVLGTASPEIRDTIPIENPRIYYGELTDNYVLTHTQRQELDFPSGEENIYNTYKGAGGIPVGQWWQRGIFAEYLKDWQMLFTDQLTPETSLLMRRNIRERIRAIAPFLQFDSDPYLVTAETDNESSNNTETNHLYWMIDAYTISDHYPYSDPGDHTFNYIRNSVTIVVDAYNGDVNFYIADPNDPIIQSWEQIFPELFQPRSAMPKKLRDHMRYPVDLFKAQSERLLPYHMKDPQVFYNREDQWQIPQEIYGNQTQPIEPYYLTMKLPQADSEEFILLLPFTPTERSNLIAWLAARSDGENYGQKVLYQLPKQQLIYGPEQIEALINQDPVISRQMSLWDRQGSSTIQGNLLIIPIENSLLYVEPVYLEAERNSLPTLIRVIVVYQNQIVMAPTLQGAINAIFDANVNSDDQGKEPAIIRPLQELPGEDTFLDELPLDDQ